MSLECSPAVHQISGSSLEVRETLLGSVAVVTGGTRGIGRSISLALAANGADVAFTYLRNQDLACFLSDEIAGLGRRSLSVQMDVRDYEAANRLVDRVKEEFGTIDILVNNAGITRDKSLMMMTRGDWSDVIDTDLSGVFNVTRSCIITFLRRKKGNIINISSASGIHPLPGQVNYAAAKAGVIGFTKSLAKEVAPHNVRVNAIAPGFIETDMTASLPRKYRERLLGSIPIGRFGQTEEVARAVVFLASDLSRYITGQVLEIEGGLGLSG
jgi:3-oxoacyl-[acyl-carrier protein] reductase